MDNRYTMNKEYCGVRENMYVVRFCGTWVGAACTKEHAIAMKNAYELNRWKGM